MSDSNKHLNFIFVNKSDLLLFIQCLQNICSKPHFSFGSYPQRSTFICLARKSIEPNAPGCINRQRQFITAKNHLIVHSDEKDELSIWCKGQAGWSRLARPI
jgi:hypothetical protein